MRRTFGALVAVAALLVGALTGVVLVAPAAVAHQSSVTGPRNSMPSSVPSSITPSVDDGAVYGIAQSGQTMVIGGTFTSVDGASHPYLLAFDSSSGDIVSGFHPTLDGYVNTVVAGPVTGTVYVGGVFTHVNGVVTTYLALLDISTGQVVSTFTTPTLDGYVNDLVLRGSKLYVAGVFTTAGTAVHGGILALNARTGAVDSSFDLQLSGHHNDSGGGAQGEVGARLVDVTANGATMVVAGNFKYVNGQLRDQIAMIKLGSSPSLAAWATDAFVPLCNSWAIDSYMRGLAFSPDGSYFVTTTKGGPHPGTACDAASRFNTNTSDSDAHPVWIDETGGDTLYGIAITGSAIFLGGHNRWMNNPLGPGKPRAGAVPRAGLQALDPISGRVLAWNPGRLPLGIAVFAILATPQGLWIGSDTDYIGNYAYKRPKIAMFPWSGGYGLASTTVAGLPGRVFLGTGGSPATNGLSAVAFDGTNATKTAADTQGVDFNRWRGAFLVGNKIFYGGLDGSFYSRTFDGTTFGPAVKIDPYHDPAWSDVQTGDGDTFEGAFPEFYRTIRNISAMTYYAGRVYFTLGGDAHLYSAWFSPDSGVIDQTITTVASSVDFANADGMFVAGGKLYYGSRTDGALRRVGFGGKGVTGSSTVVSGPSVDGVNWTNNALFLAAANGTINQPPSAQFTSSCSGLLCGFRSGSTDQDGTIVSTAWNFGDGNTAVGTSPAHTYTGAGTYTVSLTVTDNDGAAATTQHAVSVSGSAPAHQIAFVGAADAGGGSTNSKTVTVPSAATAGDVALLTFAVPSGTTVTPPSGWTQVAALTYNKLVTTVWAKVLASGDAGSNVTVGLYSYTHSALSIAVYSGVDTTSPVRSFARTGYSDTTVFQTPSAKAVAGDWAVSFWSDRSTSTRTFTAPSSVQVRNAGTDSGNLTVQSMLADSGGPVAAGGYGRVTASTDATVTGTAWTIVLKSAA